MARYGNTILTSAGLDLAKRTVNGTCTFKITRVVTSGDSTLQNATIEQVLGLTSLDSIVQTGTVTAFDTSNPKQIGLKAQFVNRGLTNQYKIYAVGIYAQEAGKSEILYAVAPAVDPETMPARPSDSEASFTFTLQIYVAVANSSSVTISATTEGVVKSINGTIKPDANGNVTVSYYSRAEVDQKVSSLSSRIDSLSSSKTNNTDFNALKSKLTDVKTQLQQTASGLTSRVGSAEGSISQLQQAAKGLTSTVSNMKAGDRNLARGVASSKDWFVFEGFNNLTNYWHDLVNYSLDTLKAGDTVTFGITIKNEGVTSGTMVIQQRGDVSLWNRDYSVISSPANVTDYVPNGTEKALTYTTTITDGMLNGNTRYYINVRTDNIPAGGKLSFRYALVKKGTLATDWTPAPEDFYDSLSNEATARTNGDSSVLSQAKAYTDDAVAKKANSTDVYTKSELNPKLADKADKTDVTALQQKVSSQETEISTLRQDADRITTTVRSGGVNLLSNSKGNFQPAGSAIDNFEYFSDTRVYMEQGKNYTLSALSGPNGFYFSSSHVPTEESERILIWLASPDPNKGIYQIISSSTTDPSLGGTHFTWNYPSDTYILRVNSYDRANRGYAYHVQIEHGDTATPWRPKPDDIDQAISKVSADLANEASARTNADNSVLSQAKTYTDYALRQAWTPTVIKTAIDLNDIKARGSYFIQNTLGTTSNTPIPNSWLFVRVEGVPTRMTQTVWRDIEPVNQWVRVFTGTWGNWVQITKAI